MDKNVKKELQQPNDGNSSSQCGEAKKTDRIHHVIHDEDAGEENVELVDSEWADFERALRYSTSINILYTFQVHRQNEKRRRKKTEHE